MKKLIIALSVFLIIFISSLSNSVAIETQINKTESNQTWIVDNEGDGDFKLIQKAINNANPGDTIEVYSGIYNEDITINKQLVLECINLSHFHFYHKVTLIPNITRLGSE